VYTLNTNEVKQFNESLLKQIFKETEKGLTLGSRKEMTNVIYDTFVGNKRYPQFDSEKLTEIDEGNVAECDAKRGIIRFGYMGHEYKINIELVK
jgi:hypothetical protein